MHLRVCGILLLLLSGIALHPGYAGRQNSPLTGLATSLADGPAPLRADLARSALLELSMAYAQEARRAREDLRTAPNKQELRRWADEIDRLAADYAALAAGVAATTPVEVAIGPDQDLHLTVAGRPVVVTGPRPRQQVALERRILQRYCNLNLCDPEVLAVTANRDNPTAWVTGAAGTSGHPEAGPGTLWSFSPAGPSCATADGLEFQFVNVDDLRRKRAACSALVAELHLLADALTRQAAAGISIDWNALRFLSSGNGAVQRVNLNTGGAVIDLKLPFLAALPEVFELVRPWLAAKVRNEKYHLVLINADRLLSPLLAKIPAP